MSLHPRPVLSIKLNLDLRLTNDGHLNSDFLANA